MPPAVAIGAGVLGSGVAGAIGAGQASSSAKKQRRAAQESFNFAQQFRPDLFQPSQQQQQALLQALQSQALAPQAQLQPEFFTRQQEQAAKGALTQDFNEQLARQREQVVASSARRGLFRSGVGAEQENQFVAEQSENLANALVGLQTQFQQQRAQEAARTFQLNQAAQQNRFGNILAAGNAQRAALGQQQALFNTLLGFSQAQAGAAGQAQQQANQALGQAIGGPFQALTSVGLAGAQGGLPNLFGGA